MKILVMSALLFGFYSCKTQVKEQYTNTVIVYMSTHGTTEKVAYMIKDSLDGEQVTLVNLKICKYPDISMCKRVIIGGSIHMGKIQSEVTRFCEKNEELLLTKEVGIYLCCMATGDAAIQEFNKAYPEKLRQNAKAKALMGYELYFEKMNFLGRSIMKKKSGLSTNVSKIDMLALNGFLNGLKNEFK